jgi:NitT/TauT family transport system substrate-binding protein
MNMKRLLALITVAALSGGLLGGCPEQNSSSNRPSTDTKPFKVAFNTWLGYSALVIAQHNGYLRDAGLDVEITFLEGIGEKNSALLRGDIDAVGHTADSAVTSIAAGVDGQIVYVFDKSFGADGILAHKDIQAIEDLRGRTVALEPGFTGHFFFLYLLREAGVPIESVKIAEMDTGSAGSAFVAGSVDAAVTWEPWIGKTKERDDAHVLITTADRPGLIIDVLFMNRETIESRQEDVDALIAAMGKATEWYLANEDAGNQIMGEFWKLPLEEVEATVVGMQFMTLADNKEFFGTPAQPGPLYGTVKSAAELWLESGVIDRMPAEPGALLYRCQRCP